MSDTTGDDIWFDLGASGGPNTIVTPAGDWKLVSGREALRQSLIRRLLTIPGQWKAKPGYGCRLLEMLRRKGTASNLESMRTSCRAACLADQRVASVLEVTISRLTDASGVPKLGRHVHIVVVPKDEPRPLEVDFDAAA
jgi:phage baseplate assembly protein W